MATHLYHTDREFQQASLDLVARLVFDRASDILSTGNPVHDQVFALKTIAQTAVFAGASNTVINTFHDLLDDENSKNNDQPGWEK